MTAPTIYNYDPVTGELGGTSFADPNPLRPGSWLFPAHCTTVVPPAAQEGKAIVWSDDAWGHVLDHRGETWWAGPNEPVEIDFIGDPAERDLVPDNPFVPPAPLDQFLTKRQVVGALIEGGDLLGRPELYDAEALIDAAIEQITDAKARAMARNDWRNVLTNYKRDHPLFNDPELMTAMNLTSDQIDTLWTLGTQQPI